VAREHVRVVLDVMAELGVFLRFEQWLEPGQARFAGELIGRAGVIVPQRQVGGLAGCNGERHTDDFRLHVLRLVVSVSKANSSALRAGEAPGSCCSVMMRTGRRCGNGLCGIIGTGNGQRRGGHRSGPTPAETGAGVPRRRLRAHRRAA
jgi:hypothetical protein